MISHQTPAERRFPVVALSFFSEIEASGGSRGTPPDTGFLRETPPKQLDKQPCALIVEDEPDAREGMVELLEGEGYCTLSAQNGQEALSLLRAGRRPRLILLDLKMPVMDGWEFCRELASDDALSEIPIAVVTASASIDRIPERQVDAGFLVKPVNVAALLSVLRRFCG